MSFLTDTLVANVGTKKKSKFKFMVTFHDENKKPFLIFNFLISIATQKDKFNHSNLLPCLLKY